MSRVQLKWKCYVNDMIKSTKPKLLGSIKQSKMTQ